MIDTPQMSVMPALGASPLSGIPTEAAKPEKPVDPIDRILAAAAKTRKYSDSPEHQTAFGEIEKIVRENTSEGKDGEEKGSRKAFLAYLKAAEALEAARLTGGKEKNFLGMLKGKSGEDVIADLETAEKKALEDFKVALGKSDAGKSKDEETRNFEVEQMGQLAREASHTQAVENAVGAMVAKPPRELADFMDTVKKGKPPTEEQVAAIKKMLTDKYPDLTDDEELALMQQTLLTEASAKAQIPTTMDQVTKQAHDLVTGVSDQVVRTATAQLADGVMPGSGQVVANAASGAAANAVGTLGNLKPAFPGMPSGPHRG